MKRPDTKSRRPDPEQKLLADLVRRMSDGVIVCDAQLRITEYTGSAERIYGWTRDAVIGKNLSSDFVTEYPDGDGEEMRRKLAAGQEARARTRALRQDGRWIDLDLLAVPLRDDHGALAGWLSVARDISEQVTANAALRAALVENGQLIAELREALHQVKTLSGCLPICSYCKKVRDDRGYWEQIERYISSHTDALFSHGLCPECAKAHYGELADER